ncbi:MAG: Uncharacterized protein G01um10143_617 [Parcubacteria group bacterium Gr01-1014_3]|nr:MAG: Uncharacterized protein G01um10143_617 [Parcubacteria group bacterium Gr01-1014_3]
MIYYDNIPHYSQFLDIPRVEWRAEGCGIAALAMEIEFYKPKSVSIPSLLSQAIKSGAHELGVGWKHKQLADLAELYGLDGINYDLTGMSKQEAFGEFKDRLAEGPVIVSVHNKFDPRAALGHMVVVTGMDNGYVFYHDPAYDNKIAKMISEKGFMKGWKQRFITVREKS